MKLGANRPDRWAIILAGGEGMRLRPLTRRLAGDERPKQFCPLMDGKTLLDRTRDRVGLIVRPDRTCLVLTRCHEVFYAPLLAEAPPGPLVVQPCGRGTVPAVLYGLLRVAEAGPLEAVAIFPSDHYVSDDARLMAHVEAAFATVEARPDVVVLLGIEAESAEVQYGWIEAGDRLLDRPASVYRVRRFWEKPAPAMAETLLQRRCLWNSLILVARVPAWLAMIRLATPRLYGAFMAAWLRRPALGESRAMRLLYARLPSANLSEDVLSSKLANLAVLPVRDVGWSDWGEPARVLRTLECLGLHPEWAEGEATPAEAGSRSGR